MRDTTLATKDLNHTRSGPWDQPHALLSSGARCTAALVLGRNVKVHPLSSTHHSNPPVCPFPDTHLPSHLVLCAVHPNPENFSTHPPPLQKKTKNPQLQIIFVSPPVSLSHICSCRNDPLRWCSESWVGIRHGGTHGSRIQQNCLLKFCAKFKANCSRWLADARLERSRTDNFSLHSGRL